jgi:4-alpha-glucanotransferase
MTALERLARHHGISTRYRAPARRVPAASLRQILAALGVDPAAPPAGPAAAGRLALPPDLRCHLPPGLSRAPGWGLFCQLYELRSARNWGIGDFRDLARLAQIAGRAGADFLGVNPLHALFLADPGRISPFSPSNRRFLNPLYIAVDALSGHAPQDLPGDLAALRDAPRVDYAGVARAKLAALDAAYRRQPFTGTAARRAFDAFVARGGTALARHALFEAISAEMAAAGRGAGFAGWPAALRDPDGGSVAEFARQHAAAVQFHLWLQWVADAQLAEAAAAARAAGMRIGLYLDLAVGEAPDGSANWADPGLMLPGLGIGAPPDVYAATGQDWGLAAPSPRALAARGFAPFRQMIAAQLAHAGALRIDHVMALWQLYLIPAGAGALAGAHLRYPLADLARVLAEESQRARALVIGEDLGFVPRGFRRLMAAANILSYRLLYFEQDRAGFIAPARWPRLSLACVSTHDLPTLAGWWQGEDIDLRRAHGLVDAARTAADRTARARDRQRLIAALAASGLDADLPPETRAAEGPAGAGLVRAVYRHLAAGAPLLVGLRLADVAGPAAPTNLPGTAASYPNWQLRSPTPLEALARLPAFAEVAAALSAARPRPA